MDKRVDKQMEGLQSKSPPTRHLFFLINQDEATK